MCKYQEEPIDEYDFWMRGEHPEKSGYYYIAVAEMDLLYVDLAKFKEEDMTWKSITRNTLYGKWIPIEAVKAYMHIGHAKMAVEIPTYLFDKKGREI